MFFDIGKPIAEATNAAVQWLIVNYGDAFDSFANGLLTVLVFIERLLRGAPPWAILVAVAAIAWIASRRPLLAVGVTVLTYLIGCLGLWEQAMQTIAIIIVSVGIAVVLGIPFGVLTARSNLARTLINPLLDLMQTIPSFVYLIPAAMLFGLGKVPAILATVIYATPPLIRLTDLGIRQVDAAVVEASRAFGATRWQMLTGVQVPLALPSIMQGINQTILMALSMVVIASMIGARGIGETVLIGLQRNDAGTGLLGGIAIVLLAIVFDRITQAFGARLQAYRAVKSEPMALIEAKHLTKIFGPAPKKALARLRAGASKEELLAETGNTVGLYDVSISVERGETYVVMGLSGSGKSTFIRHLNRLIDPTDGEIVIDGVDILSLSIRELERFRRRKMAMVFQRFGLLPHRTVLRNIGYGLEIQGVSQAERDRRSREWVETVGLAGYEDHYPSELSGGMQQRVGLARALCADAEILLMDEAFSALDPLIRGQMQDLLMELQARLHKTIVFITHDLDEALRLGNRIAILKDGTLSQVGTPVEILLSPADAYVRAFVKDVNRARVLTVETVMKPPPLRLTDETLEQALAAMQAQGARFGYLVGDTGYRGVVTREAVDAALASHSTPAIADIVVSAPTIDPGASLADALPASLSSAFPLAVVDAEGGLAGVLPADRVGEILTSPDEKLPAE